MAVNKETNEFWFHFCLTRLANRHFAVKKSAKVRYIDFLKAN